MQEKEQAKKKRQWDAEQEIEQFKHDKLVICRAIKIAEKSIADGNMELEAVIRTKSINYNGLAAAQNMISMGSQKKGRAFIRDRSSWERYERDKKEEK